MDWRQVDLLMLAGRDAGLHRINKAIWNKGAGGMGSLYRSAYEEVVVFCSEPTDIPGFISTPPGALWQEHLRQRDCGGGNEAAGNERCP